MTLAAELWAGDGKRESSSGSKIQPPPTGSSKWHDEAMQAQMAWRGVRADALVASMATTSAADTDTRTAGRIPSPRLARLDYQTGS